MKGAGVTRMCSKVAPNEQRTFQILRCFGQMITKLKVDFVNKRIASYNDNYYRILSFINQFCCTFLIQVSFCPAYAFEYFERTFVNVELVIMHRSGSKLKFHRNMFPKLSRLDLFLEKNIIPEIDHFWRLRHLKLESEYPLEDKHIIEIANILRLNPQLQILEGVLLDSFCLLRDISHRLQSIISLEIATEHTNSTIPWQSSTFSRC